AIVMLLYIDAEVRKARPQTHAELFAAIGRGAAMRVRPKLMTVFTLLVGLAPIFLTDGLGSDVMRRIALPMLGGMASTLVLTLIVIPAIYYIRVGAQLSKSAPQPIPRQAINPATNEGQTP
ncbi:MAG: efflux RND transporter permease subunit, partial [Alphaproteobacteria bacterium]|nr:efflux RND transporter permease subunit [Alphaproteobacteria bacterium]